MSNNRSLVLVIIALLLVIVWLMVKSPVPVLPRPPLREDLPKHEKVQKLRTVTGIVTAYKNNPHLDINALELKTKTAGMMTIDFRPHTAEAVKKIGITGQLVTITYSLHPNDEIVGYQLMAIKNNKTGLSQVLENLPPPPDIPDHETESFKLNKPLIITDQYGGIVALKQQQLLFHFKPGLVDNIAPLIKLSQQLNLVAVRRPDNLGFVNVNHDKVYIVLSITMDNKTFLVR